MSSGMDDLLSVLHPYADSQSWSLLTSEAHNLQQQNPDNPVPDTITTAIERLKANNNIRQDEAEKLKLAVEIAKLSNNNQELVKAVLAKQNIQNLMDNTGPVAAPLNPVLPTNPTPVNPTPVNPTPVNPTPVDTKPADAVDSTSVSDAVDAPVGGDGDAVPEPEPEPDSEPEAAGNEDGNVDGTGAETAGDATADADSSAV